MKGGHNMTKKEKVRQKIEDIRWKAKQKAIAAKEWVVNNKEVVILATPVIIKAGKEIYKSHHKTAAQKWQESERRRIETTYYDPSSGLHWKLNREPTNEERIVIDRKRREGYDVGEVLMSLGLI